jgi:hypothetical protein
MSPVVARPAEVPPRPLPPPHVPDVRVAPASPLVPQVPVLIAPKWEYKRLTRAADAPALEETELDTVGREGWELVGVVTDARAVHFYFKREAP